MSNPPFLLERDQRLLAAIVFSDVVGFSRRMQQEESTTLKLLERDFVSMRAFCGMYSGRVIKSTGDGLLLFFTSAVQAVEWALKTQRHFADQAAELPAREVLRHRIGIHLGEVILSGHDVMGDGVNIAARVQAQAQPGGICISQMVFSVVKNKLKLDAVPLELRQLKNINEPVQMYRLLLEPPMQRMPGVRLASPGNDAAARGKTSAWKKWAAAGAGVAVVALAGLLLLQAHRGHQHELAASQQIRDALDSAMRKGDRANEPLATRAPATAGVKVVNAVPPVTVEPAYDFARLAMARPLGGAPRDQDEPVIQAANDSLGALTRWTSTALERYTRESPLHVTPLRSGGVQSSTLFRDSKGELYFAAGGAVRKVSWTMLPPDVRGAIVTSLLLNSPSAPPQDVVRAAEAFAYIHQLPEMAEMLLRGRMTR